MRPLFRLRTVSFFPFLLCFLICHILPALGAENISEINRAAFEQKVKELLKSEFYAVVRGRAKPKPLRINDAAVIQHVIKTGNDVFQNLYTDFLESQRVLEDVFSNIPSYISKETAFRVKQELNAQILSLVVLDKKIKNARSFYELKNTMDYSRSHLMLMPMKISLLQKVIRDIDTLSGKSPSQFPDAYRERADGYLIKISGRMIESAEDIFSFDAEAYMRQLFGFLAQLELGWLEDTKQAMENKNSSLLPDEQFATATFRAQDGVVVVYGDEKSLSFVVDEIKQRANSVLLTQNAAAFIHDKNIPGVQRVESFYFYENSEPGFFKDSVRSAEFLDMFPLFEGLDKAQAGLLLNAFGYEIEFLEDCNEKTLDDVRRRMQNKFSQKFRRVALLCGTDADSILFSAWQ